MSKEVTSPRCYIRHLRQANLCGKGSRAWCEHHGVDWTDFLDNGIEAQRLLDSGDPIVRRVVEAARKEQADGVGR